LRRQAHGSAVLGALIGKEFTLAYRRKIIQQNIMKNVPIGKNDRFFRRNFKITVTGSTPQEQKITSEAR
jgi:hypothetical protein